MPGNRQDFVGPILLAIFAYLASMLTRAFQRSLLEVVPNSESSSFKKSKVEYTIIDNFITDPSILNKLQDANLWNDCVVASPKWWNGRSKPKNIWEELTQRIWEERPEYKDAAIGFEYWCDILSDQESTTWHIDKDEHELEQNNRLIFPIMGAVYYGFHHPLNQGGGYLNLIDADVRDNPLEFDVVRKNEVVEISPNYNRMVLFNSSKWHKVTSVTGGKRYAFVSNANSHVPKTLTRQGKKGSA